MLKENSLKIPRVYLKTERRKSVCENLVNNEINSVINVELNNETSDEENAIILYADTRTSKYTAEASVSFKEKE